MNRRRGSRRLAGRVLAATGAVVLLAAGFVQRAEPAARHAVPLARPDGADFGGQTTAQAFSAAHYGPSPLSQPAAFAAALAAGARQAAAVPEARGPGLGAAWQLRGPATLYANDPARSGSLTELGFRSLAGRITAVATTPGQPDLVYAGAADGGVWRSTDAGAHWTPVFDTQPTLAIGGIAIDPSDPSRVYVGTGEANTNADAFYGDGMYATDDAGAHWRHVSLPGVLTVFHVEVAAPTPGHPERVFAATNDGLWLSTDDGRSYANVELPTNAAHTGVYTATPFGNFVTDVRVRPGHPGEVLAVVGWRRGRAPDAAGVPDSVGNGFYRSTSYGAPGTFTYLPQTEPAGLGVPGNNANPYASSDPIGRTSIAYSADGKYLWAVVQDAGTFDGETFQGVPLPASTSVLNGVYLSPDASATSWVPKGNTETFAAAPGSALTVLQGLLYGPGVQSWYDQWIAVDPGDDNRVLVGLEEVYEAVANATAPAGYAGWRTVARYWNACVLVNFDCSTVPGPVYAGATTHPDQHGYAFVRLPSGATRLYTGSDGGMFRQDSHVTDLGYTGYDNSSWSYLNTGLATTQPYYAQEGSDGTVYAGLQDNGEEKLAPGSTRGDEIYGGDGFDTAVVPGNSKQVYEEYVYGQTSVSTDGGLTWFPDAPCDAGDPTMYQFATPFVLDPTNADHVVIAGRVVHESTRGVATDTEATANCAGSTGVGVDWSNTYDLGPSVVATHPEVRGGGVNNVATAVAVRGAYAYVPYCGVCDPLTQARGDFADFHNGLATNVAPGCRPAIGSPACWHHAKLVGLPNRYIQGVALDPRDPATVYVTLTGYLRRWFPAIPPTQNIGGGHVYVSHDGGDHFADVSGNLPQVPANAVVLRDGRVYVGTDMGVYTAAMGSDHWSRLGRGLPNASVLDLELNPQGSQLVAATHGRGVWVYPFGRPAAPAYQKSAGTAPTGTVPSGTVPSGTAPSGTAPSGGGLVLRPGLPATAGRLALVSLGLALLLAPLLLAAASRRRAGQPGCA